MLADNIRIEVVTIHRSQEMLKMLSLHMESVSLKKGKDRSKNPSCTYITTDTNFYWMQQNLMAYIWIVISSSDHFAYLCIP
jgi:hypothetical protein